MTIILKIAGSPATAGSKNAFPIERSPGKWGCVLTDASGKKGKDWRRLVQAIARQGMIGREMMEGVAVEFELTTYLKRPKSHYRTGKFSEQLKPSSPTYPIYKPDVTKLMRATEDALAGIVWKDDCQVTDQVNRKRYAPLGTEAGAVIIIKSKPIAAGGF